MNFYYDKDNDSCDIFENKLAEKRIQEEVKGDINLNIYDTIDVVSKQVIISKNMYDNIEYVLSKYDCSQDDGVLNTPIPYANDDYYFYNDIFVNHIWYYNAPKIILLHIFCI